MRPCVRGVGIGPSTQKELKEIFAKFVIIAFHHYRRHLY